MHISLVPMTRELCRAYWRGFEPDTAIYMDMDLFKPYVYSDERANVYYDRQIAKQRVLLAILRDGQVAGEVCFKDMDKASGACTLGIHLQNDGVKGKGVGTQAIRLALRHAFEHLGMNTVYADAVLKNKRSQHVLEKTGFRFMREEGIFRFYRFAKDDGVDCLNQ